MMGLINFLKKRPNDSTIKYSRIIFGFIYISALYYNLIIQGDSIQSELFWIELSSEKLEYIKYAIISIGFVPIVMGITNICLLKSKYMRFLQIFFAITLFYISSIIVEAPTLEVDTLIGLMGVLPLLAGISGKCITTKCLRYKEKITKIRI